MTIDGPAGAGKSTVARRVASALGLPYLNSGSIYRAVTLRCIEEGIAFADEGRVLALIDALDLAIEPSTDALAEPRVLVGGRDVTARLTSPEVSAAVHRVAGVGPYRDRLVEFQRRFALAQGLVTDGRDMGTVIFPDASLKVYLDASPRERARRRHRELAAAGVDVSLDSVLSDIERRDAADQSRAQAPLRVPDGAVVIDSDGKDPDAVAGEILELVR